MDASSSLLLTGGTGFFGRALLRHWAGLHAAGQAVPAVTVLSRDPAGFLSRHPEFAAEPWLQWHAGDILRPDSLPRRGAYTHLLHGAADTVPGPELGPLQRYTQIVDGTRHLLEFAAAHGVRRFLLASSGAVYGPQPATIERVPEDCLAMPDPLQAANAYDVAKRTAEHLCALYGAAKGLETVIARAFAFVGPDLPRDAHFAIGNFIRDALDGEAIVVAGDGTPLRSYLDQRDLAHWLDTLLQAGTPGRAYNVGSDEAISIADLAHLVRDVLAPAKPVHIRGRAEPGAPRARYVPDIRRAQAELGLAVRVSLRDAIAAAAMRP